MTESNLLLASDKFSKILENTQIDTMRVSKISNYFHHKIKLHYSDKKLELQLAYIQEHSC